MKKKRPSVCQITLCVEFSVGICSVFLYARFHKRSVTCALIDVCVLRVKNIKIDAGYLFVGFRSNEFLI